MKSIGHNLDGNAVGNDFGIGFAYNPASQVTARAQTNGIYAFPIAAVNQTYTSNGRNQYTQCESALKFDQACCPTGVED